MNKVINNMSIKKIYTGQDKDFYNFCKDIEKSVVFEKTIYRSLHKGYIPKCLYYMKNKKKYQPMLIKMVDNKIREYNENSGRYIWKKV